MPIHALLIDDDSFNLEVLGRLLAAEGNSYTTMQDPSQIANLNSSHHFDIVFLDLEMPKVDGYKAFQMLKEKLGKDVPIIACTVHSTEIENVRGLGFDGFLGKPLDKSRFSEQLRRIMDGQAVWEID